VPLTNCLSARKFDQEVKIPKKRSNKIEDQSMVSKTIEANSKKATSTASTSTSSDNKSSPLTKEQIDKKMAATSRQASKRQHSSTRKQAEFYKISEEKLHEYKEAFNMLDENCDGLISAAEIKSMFAKIEQPISDDEVKVMLKEIDLDGNEFIDLDEFIQMMVKYENRITPEQYEVSLRRVFEIFDLDKNSFITETELKEVMAKLGEHLSDEEVADMIRVADEDGDGRINFNEFKTIMEFVKTGKSSKLNPSRINRTSNQNVNEKHVKKK